MAEERQKVRRLPETVLRHRVGRELFGRRVPQAERDQRDGRLFAMRKVREQELRVRRVGRQRRRRQLGLEQAGNELADEAGVLRVAMRRGVCREEVMRRDVEPLRAQVRSDLGSVANERMIVEVVPVAESAELVVLEQLVGAEGRFAILANLPKGIA